MHTLARAFLTVGLAVILVFCVFGFLASYEYPEKADQFPWQLGYGIIGVLCVLGTVWLWRSRRFSRSLNETKMPGDEPHRQE